MDSPRQDLLLVRAAGSRQGVQPTTEPEMRLVNHPLNPALEWHYPLDLRCHTFRVDKSRVVDVSDLL